MRIDPQIPAADNSATSRVNDARSGAVKNTPPPVSSAPQDTVQLSSSQTTVSQLVAQLSQVPYVREQKVSALRLEIQSGQFQRTNEQVAGAIVNELFGIDSNA
jgi:flagellar biosynthesis anti-sigma factor FlgM